MRRVLEDSRGFARCVAHDDTAHGVRRRARHSCQLEGQRIRQRCVPVVAAEEDRGLIGRGVDHLARGELGRGPRLLIPISAQQPAARRERPCLFSDAPREFFLAACVFQVNGEKLEAAANEVCVAVNQPRHGKAALQVNNVGIPAGVGLNLGIAAHRQDAAIRDRQCLGKLRRDVLGPQRFSRPNLSVQQNQVRAVPHLTPGLRGSKRLYHRVTETQRHQENKGPHCLKS